MKIEARFTLDTVAKFQDRDRLRNELVGKDYLVQLINQAKGDEYNPIRAWLGTVEPNCLVTATLTLTVLR